MRKLVALIIGVMAFAAITVTPALAQVSEQVETKLKVEAKVTPNKAGTPKNPQGVVLSGKLTWTNTEGFEPPVITAFDVVLSKGGRYNGGKYPKCSYRTLARDAGPAGCPKQSIMGAAKAKALADRVVTRPKVTFVNVGAKDICFYTVLINPALVQRCVKGKIKRLGNGGYRITIKVPEVLQVVAGVPIALRELTFKAGGKPYAKEWITTTSCPKSKKWSFSIETSYEYVDGSTDKSSFADKVPCR